MSYVPARRLMLAVGWLRPCGVSAFVHAGLLIGLGMMGLGGQIGKKSVDELLVVQQLEPVPQASFMVLTAPSESQQASLSKTDGGGAAPGDGPGQGGAAKRIDARLNVELEDLGGGKRDRGIGLTALGPGDMREAKVRSGEDAKFFGIRAAGKKFVFVVDCSGSMHNEGRFRRALGELKQSLRGLTSSQEYYVIFFSGGAIPMPTPTMLTATNENLRQTFVWMGQVELGGGTFPLTAMQLAYDLNPDAIFLLTDGAFGSEVFDYLRLKPTGEIIPVFTVALMNREGEPMLRAISHITRGIFRMVH